MSQFRLSRAHIHLVLLALSATTCLAASEAPEPDLRLADTIVPVFQDIHLKLDADQESYAGTVKVELESRTPSDIFHFHSEGPTFTRFTLLDAEGNAIEASHTMLDEDVVEVKLTEPLPKGRYRLEIDFTNPFDVQASSLYRMEHRDRGYAFTQFEDIDAREAFPCWDEPRFKIPFRMTLTVPEAHVAITNTPPERTTVADGWRTTVFRRTPPLPTYLLAIATGPLESVEIPGMSIPGRILTVEGRSGLTSLAVEVTPRILAALEKWFDRPYPYAKLDFIAIPEFWYGAMENPGAITYRESLLVIDPTTATASQRRTQARVITHELAHIWFGDLVTMEWWDDLWLNESFADWMADKITHRLFPDLGVDIDNADAAQSIMVQDARASAVPVRKPILSTDGMLQDVGLAYSKGKTVLGMFERFMGEEPFRQGVLAYIEDNAWGSAVAGDLWQALDTTAKDAGFSEPISKSMAPFLDQPGVPLVRVERRGDGRLVLRQERFKDAGTQVVSQQWRVPVQLRWGTQEGPRFRTVLLTEENQEIEIGAQRPEWIFPHGDAAGYYRWSLPPEDLQRLAERADEILTPRERVALVGNLDALLRAGELGGNDFLAVLGALASDPEPFVVRAVTDALSSVEMAFITPELKDEMARWLRRALGPALERIGREPRPGETESAGLARPALLSWLGDAGRDAGVREYARRAVRAHLAGEADIEPSLINVMLRLAAIDGDAELFDAYRQRFETAELPAERSRFLGALGAFRDPDLEDRALRYSFSGPLRPPELFSVGGSIADSAAGREKVFRFFLDNWDTLAERLPPTFLAFMPGLASGCSLKRLETAETFFQKPDHSFPGTERSLQRTREQVEGCVSLRQREGGAVADYLQSLED